MMLSKLVLTLGLYKSLSDSQAIEVFFISYVKFEVPSCAGAFKRMGFPMVSLNSELAISPQG